MNNILDFIIHWNLSLTNYVTLENLYKIATQFTEKIKVDHIHEPHRFIYISVGLNVIVPIQVYIFGLGQYFSNFFFLS